MKARRVRNGDLEEKKNLEATNKVDIFLLFSDSTLPDQTGTQYKYEPCPWQLLQRLLKRGFWFDFI